MSRVDDALEFILANEGGWANVSGDKGGPTNWGITLGVYKGRGRDHDGDGDIDVDDLKLLTKEEAKQFYVENYLFVMDGIEDCKIAVYLADIAVNSGPRTAVRMLQDALQLIGIRVTSDGIKGPQTLAAVASAPKGSLFSALQVSRAVFYRSLVRNDPGQEKFLRGWLLRAQRVPRCA